MPPKLAGRGAKPTQQCTCAATTRTKDLTGRLQPPRETASRQISSSTARPGTQPGILGSGPRHNVQIRGDQSQTHYTSQPPPGTLARYVALALHPNGDEAPVRSDRQSGLGGG
ncbi:hypothetical protein NDU88_005494 [Pleurodeles waltl]|uniref:Uncharacterized protein n=1 Tax=Pleurodeles waltl TaxID=8319 RepID=A0AAV7WYW5_PLEWA|nr:hypothetical protein NDU88_005494 [Pleurodeles waltl]